MEQLNCNGRTKQPGILPLKTRPFYSIHLESIEISRSQIPGYELIPPVISSSPDLILPRGIQLHLSNDVINLLHDLRCKLLQDRQRLAVLNDLLGPRRARDDRRYVGVLQAPRKRQLCLADAEFVCNGLGVC
jgi:hypothetical protein